MPTYEYRCKKCGYTFERLQSIADRPVRRCPKCKGAVERLIGAGAGLIFKGSGFYETDYKRKDSTPATSGTKSSKTDDKT
jgi:putative FmdB family regulatory protein